MNRVGAYHKKKAYWKDKPYTYNTNPEKHPLIIIFIPVVNHHNSVPAPPGSTGSVSFTGARPNMLDMYASQSCALQGTILTSSQRKEKKSHALEGGWHRRPHHHRIPIDTDLSILQQHRSKMPQHRFLVRRRHTVPAKFHLHPVHVEHTGAAAEVGAWLEPILW